MITGPKLKLKQQWTGKKIGLFGQWLQLKFKLELALKFLMSL